MNRLRILIVDDHQLFREGVRYALEANDDIEVVGDVEDGRQAVRMTDELVPDIVLVDINIPGLNGLEVTRAVRRSQPHIAVIILTVNEDDEQLFNATRVGAAACLTKDISAAQLLSVIRTVGEGFFPINEAILSRPMVASRMLNQFRELTTSESEGEDPVDRKSTRLNSS